jgi:hypothetical protein
MMRGDLQASEGRSRTLQRALLDHICGTKQFVQMIAKSLPRAPDWADRTILSRLRTRVSRIKAWICISFSSPFTIFHQPADIVDEPRALAGTMDNVFGVKVQWQDANTPTGT